MCIPCLSILYINHSFYKALCQWKLGENFVNFLAYNIEKRAQDQSLAFFLWKQIVGEVKNVIIFNILSIDKIFIILFTTNKYVRVKKNKKMAGFIAEKLNSHKILNLNMYLC